MFQGNLQPVKSNKYNLIVNLPRRFLGLTKEEYWITLFTLRVKMMSRG